MVCGSVANNNILVGVGGLERSRPWLIYGSWNRMVLAAGDICH